MTITDLFALSDDDLVEAAFDAWLNSDVCGHYDRSDVTDRCSEDTTRDRAVWRLSEWFVEFMADAPDPDENYGDGYSEGEEARITRLSDDFAECCIDSILDGSDYYETLRSLPR